MIKIPYVLAFRNLLYAMVCTRLCIAHAAGVVNRFFENLNKQHWEVVKWILRCLKGTSNSFLCFVDNSSVLREGYINKNMPIDVDTRNSTTIYLYTFVCATIY